MARRHVSAGECHSLAITADGSVWSWGWGGNGRLGHGDQQLQLLPKKIEALAGQRVIAVSAEDHSIALTADGAVWSWGDGAGGRLGHGDEQEQASCCRRRSRPLLARASRTAIASTSVPTFCRSENRRFGKHVERPGGCPARLTQARKRICEAWPLMRPDGEEGKT